MRVFVLTAQKWLICQFYEIPPENMRPNPVVRAKVFAQVAPQGFVDFIREYINGVEVKAAFCPSVEKGARKCADSSARIQQAAIWPCILREQRGHETGNTGRSHELAQLCLTLPGDARGNLPAQSFRTFKLLEHLVPRRAYFFGLSQILRGGLMSGNA